MRVIEGGVTAAKGYKASGLRAGIKAGKTNKDMAMIYSEKEAVCAGTFTKNVVKAAPVFWDRDIVYKEGKAQAVVVNSGIANACTGEEGLANCKKEAQKAGELLNVAPEHVLVASTGVIGAQLVMDVVEKGIEMLVPQLAYGKEAAENAATAILTTDTCKKEIAVECTLGGKTVTIGGMCKGAGMIHPNMATMLGFITTDASISPVLLQKALSEDVETSFNQITIDGDTSTNDTVLVMANGQAGHDKITTASSTYDHFKTMLHTVTTALSIGIASDGEGATKLLAVTVKNSESSLDARMVAKKVVGSSLVKTAMFGKDPNWGRIIAAIGASDVTVDPDIIDISLNTIPVMTDGAPTDFNQEAITEALEQKKIAIDIDLHNGSASGQAWGSDLTYDYVKINALYST